MIVAKQDLLVRTGDVSRQAEARAEFERAAALARNTRELLMERAREVEEGVGDQV
jgi:predicted RNA polymerase sigma factor